MRSGANHSKQHKCKVTCANLSRAYRRARARHDKTEKNVRATTCSAFTSRDVTNAARTTNTAKPSNRNSFHHRCPSASMKTDPQQRRSPVLVGVSRIEEDPGFMMSTWSGVVVTSSQSHRGSQPLVAKPLAEPLCRTAGCAAICNTVHG